MVFFADRTFEKTLSSAMLHELTATCYEDLEPLEVPEKQLGKLTPMFVYCYQPDLQRSDILASLHLLSSK